VIQLDKNFNRLRCDSIWENFNYVKCVENFNSVRCDSKNMNLTI
jgi:hypothetical protein